MGRGEGGGALGEGIADAWLGAAIEEGTVMGGTAVATPPFFLFFFRDFFASSSAACSIVNRDNKRVSLPISTCDVRTYVSHRPAYDKHLWLQVLYGYTWLQ